MALPIIADGLANHHQAHLFNDVKSADTIDIEGRRG